MFDLSGKTAIVTGATKGLGYGIAQGFAQCGANLVIVSRNSQDCHNVAEELAGTGVKTLPYACDVTIHNNVLSLVQKTIEVFGRIDILVNNAGTAVTKRAESLTEDDWDRVMNINLKSVFLLSQAAGIEMIRQGSGKIINVASMFGIVGEKGILPYLASKGGVIQLTKGLALEWARHNIQVNAVAPGYVKTAINQKELETEDIKQALLAKTPMRRYGLPEEVASVVTFLASEES